MKTNYRRAQIFTCRIVLAILISSPTFLAGNPILAEPGDAMKPVEKEGPGTYQVLHKAEGPIIIPFKMHNGKPLMDVEINGEKAALMIDNGVLWDQVWLFGSPLVEELDLKPIDEYEVGGAGEGDPTRAYNSENLTLKFRDVIFYEQPVLVSPAAAGFARMFPGSDGQLCNTFFKHFIVEFDFIENRVLLHDPDKFNYTGKGSVLDLKQNESGTWSVPFEFSMKEGKSFKDRVDVDFGGIYELKIALNNSFKIKVPEGSEPALSLGAQGRSTEYYSRIGSMTIGKYRFDNPVAYFGDEGTSRIHPENLGVIGLPLFMKFKITFDYLNNKLYLEPNENFDGVEM